MHIFNNHHRVKSYVCVALHM